MSRAISCARVRTSNPSAQRTRHSWQCARAPIAVALARPPRPAAKSPRRVRVEGNRVADDVLGRNVVLTDTPAGEVTVGPGQGWVR